MVDSKFSALPAQISSDSDDSDYSPPNSRKGSAPRPKSSSFIALKDAVYQLTCLNDFTREKIGQGFFAEVFKVTHKNTGEVMVLKLNKSRNNSKQMLAEIQLLNRLSHSNILGFRGSCVHEGSLHALTEYINGGTLEELLSSDANISWSKRIKIAHDIANGMAYLHNRGVFHRDLTSKNCLIQKSDDGSLNCVVADFGLAAKIKHKRRSYTEIVGTCYWMAPECLSNKEYGEQSDVFSYGIILAEVMSRLQADPDFMPRTNDFGVDYDKLKVHCKDCPETLWELMSQCTQVDPDGRPTFDEIVQILDPLFSAYQSNSTPPITLPIAPLSNPSSPSKVELPLELCPSPQSSPSSLLSSLLGGSAERDGIIRERKISTVSLDSGCGPERVDPSSYWKGIGFYKTPSLTDGKTTPLTPSSTHFRQISDSSEVSFQLPSPSFAWAPPPSPCTSLYRLSLTSPVDTPSHEVGALREESLSSPEHSPITGEELDHPPSPDPLSNSQFDLEDWSIVRTACTNMSLVEEEEEEGSGGILTDRDGRERIERRPLFNRASCSTPNLQTC